MNHVMNSGKKSVAEKIVYGALDRIQSRSGKDPIEVFDAALEAVAPTGRGKIHGVLVVRPIKSLLKCDLPDELPLRCAGS